MGVFNGHINDEGVLLIQDRHILNAWVKGNAGRNVTVEVKIRKKPRSNPQNAYYWAVIVPMLCDGLNHMGHEFDLEDTHEFIKANFNYKEIVNTDTGEVLRSPQSTTALSTFEFSEMKEKIQKWAVEWLNIIIPDPNENGTLNFDNEKA
jgi:hypothetical protein